MQYPEEVGYNIHHGVQGFEIQWVKDDEYFNLITAVRYIALCYN